MLQISAGLGALQLEEGERRQLELGLWLHPRAAVGVPVGEMSLELGPTWSGLTPFFTHHKGRPIPSEVPGVLLLELSLSAGRLAPR